MSWSIIKEEGKIYNPVYLFQPFTVEEWNQYPFAGEEKLKWFRDAKLGLFFHVGISSVGKVDIGWSRETHKIPDSGKGFVPDEVYDGWANEISLEEFDADEWIDLAVKGGFKYVVIITKHHDGFNMWDTEYSDYKITNSPFARDYLKELTDACHKRNMPVGLYYSQRDWHHPDYEPIDNDIVTVKEEIPFYDLKEGEQLRYGKNHEKYLEYMHNSVMELMKKYGKIDILWWDACWYNKMFLEYMWKSSEIEANVRKQQNDIIINNRASVPGDFDTPECRIGFVQRKRMWETCMPLGKEWAWTGSGIKTHKEIMHQILYSVCGDGNFLLSIGCMPNGKIADEEKEAIIKIGEWMNKYKESVYGTRSGPWNPGNYGGSVFKDNKAYLHILNTEEVHDVLFPVPDNEIAGVKCLNHSGLDYEVTGSGLIIHKVPHDDVDTIVEIEFKEPIQLSIEGLTVDEDLENSRESYIYGGKLVKETLNENTHKYEFDKLRKVTALEAVTKAGKFKVRASVDNQNWEYIECKAAKDDYKEYEFNDYVAGAPVCGKEFKYIEITADKEIGQITLYGF